jgi:RNA polymerase sigma factor (sigma-70 family)
MPVSSPSDPNPLSWRWRPALMSFFLRRVKRRAEAEDLTQEVFARLLTLPEADLPGPYVFKVAANLLRDNVRRTRVREQYQESLTWEADHGVERRDPLRIAGGRDEMAVVIAALEALPERTRAIFILYRIENMDLALIASSLGISKSAVKKHARRALTSLTERMRDAQ